MEFRTAYVERTDGPLGIEERLVTEELARRGVPVRFFHLKEIHRRTLPLDDHAFLMGTVPAVHGALKQLGVPVPPPNDYPEVLGTFLRRRVWRTTLREFEEQVREGLPKPIFAKPAGRLKGFTGRVFHGPEDLYRLAGVSRRQEIWCSEVVRWIAEYRAYVINGAVVALDCYDGDGRDPVSRALVDDAVQTYKESGGAPSAYGIDFGVLVSGETALVEANDGYSLGAYDIAAAPYTDLLLTRWAELLRRRA